MLLRCIPSILSRQTVTGGVRSLASHHGKISGNPRLIHQQRSLVLPSTSCMQYSTSNEGVTQVPENEGEHGELVYKGLVSTAVKNVKLFSLSTSCLGLGMQPILFQRAGELGKLGLAVGGMCSFFIFLTPLLLHWITKKYVVHLYFKPVERLFTAETFSFFARKKYTMFTPDDVSVPAVPGAFTSILVRGNALFMDPRYFDNPEAYKIMMGYDKPVDWAFPDDIKELQAKHNQTETTGQSSGEDEINRRREE